MIELLKDQIEVKDYFDIYEDIKHIEGKVLLDTKSVNYALVSSYSSRKISLIKQTQVNYLNQLKTKQKSKQLKMLIYMMVLLLLNLCIG